ncbi:Acetyltransferase (GNAT) family protein [Sulfitobacter sp. THAF37]|uniref:GNAT family N-acetyltransferase n=1 Tax=Sulfitobacter sp. THAF37 TaxID=2587855 RepID=UPI001269196B|nr:GNAT family N-acetyltransferase [Sulfitobacter sp. THAF37]QFT59899.1 Acetyltransferase (GNAT) family protein [Sulfitobacter sp. THAF37]
MTVTIRPTRPEDRDGWDLLYQGYAEFYRVDQTAQMRDTVFGWLMDEAHECKGFVAEGPDGQLIGLTHFRPFASPLRAATNCFLDDLFVDPAARGSGAAQALIDAVADHARARGWATVRWITADDNYRGRSVYDRMASRTMWITYDLKT